MRTNQLCVAFLVHVAIVGSNPQTFTSRSFSHVSRKGLKCKPILHEIVGPNSILDCAILCSSITRCISYLYNRNSADCVFYDHYLTDESSCTSKTGYSYYLTMGTRILRGACADTYVMDTEAQLCFKLYTDKKVWSSARKICHKDGADLISLNTEKKLEVFKRYILKEEARAGRSEIEYYLGGYLDTRERVWRWMSDFSVVKDFKFKSKKDRCLEFQSDPDSFGFDDTNCHTEYQPFVCEINV